MRHNGGRLTKFLFEEGHFAIFDSLSPALRRGLNECHYPLKVGDIKQFVERCLATGMPQNEIDALLLQRMKDAMERQTKAEALKVYGPDHPQATDTFKPMNPQGKKLKCR